MIKDKIKDFKDGILELDFTADNSLNSPLIQKEIRDDLRKLSFERLIIDTKYFRKEYDSELNLLSVEPFFVDISLYNPHPSYKTLSTYLVDKLEVRVLDVDDLIEKFYEISISEDQIPLKILKNIHEELEDYEKSGQTKNSIITRWYKEFGVLEYLMKDERVLEININPPGFKTPMRIVHTEFGECVTNIYPSQSFLDYFLTRLKMNSGRPLNKVSPELDSEIKIGNIKGRVAVVVDPFSIFGPAFSIRKHREKPWTFELFIKNKTMNSLFAGFMGLIISSGRSYIFAGPRGSGKTSLMTASLLQIPTNDRMITIEDTQEIPIETFKTLGYDLLSLKVRSALLDEGMEIDFEKGLRTTLRLGDSCLILGEIRGKEAKVLYEAMRVGAMSNVVTGTIHADTPYGVYDRVVNDLGVTKGSFKVTDILILVNVITDSSGTRKIRRIVEVAEVLKDWDDEPEFQTLFKYDSKSDNLEPTREFIEGKSVVLQSLLKSSNFLNSTSDLLKDIEIRTNIKNITLKCMTRDEHLEAIHTKRLDTIFLKLYQKLENLNDKTEIFGLYREYQKQAKSYLERV